MAYTMVAERDNQKVTKERTSALILLANARVWASEGWQVVITDADGKELDPAGFDKWLAPADASPLQPANSSSLQEQDLSTEAVQLGAEFEESEYEESDEYEEAYEELNSESLASEDLDSEDLDTEDLDSENLDSSEYPRGQDFSEANGSLT